MMTDNRGFMKIPANIIEAIDRLVTASYKLGEAVREGEENTLSTLQSHEDAMYDNLLMQIDRNLENY
jgi:hypothetical protein